MNFRLETPEAVVKAREAQKGMNWFLEILVFGLIFFAVSIVESILMIPGMLLAAFSNPDFVAASLSGDEAALNGALDAMVNSDSVTLLMLFANLAMIGVVMLFCKALQKRKMNTLGFVKKNLGREYLKGLGFGFLLFSAAVLICVVTGTLKIEGISPGFTPGIFLLFALGFLIQGMAEEVLCRGYFLVSCARRHSLWAAVLANSLLFAALHLANDGISPLAFVNLTLFGVFASVYFIKSGNIWGVGALHSIWNLAQGNIYGIRVSGIVTECSVFASAPSEGGFLLNGGAFGLEGGLAVTIVLLAGTCFLLRKSPEGGLPEAEAPETETPETEVPAPEAEEPETETLTAEEPEV